MTVRVLRPTCFATPSPISDMQTPPLNSQKYLTNSPPSPRSSLHEMLDRILVLQPSMEKVLTKQFLALVESAERIAAQRELSTLCLVASLFLGGS